MSKWSRLLILLVLSGFGASLGWFISNWQHAQIKVKNSKIPPSVQSVHSVSKSNSSLVHREPIRPLTSVKPLSSKKKSNRLKDTHPRSHKKKGRGISSKEDYVYVCLGQYAKRYHYSRSCFGLKNCRGGVKKVTLKRAQYIGRSLCKRED